jgi:hypothetical protein
MTAKNDKPIGGQSDRNAEDLAMLRRIEAELAVEKLRAQKSASELAGEHLGMWGGGYLCVLVIVYFGSILFLPSDAISAVTGVVTLIVTSMIQLLKQVVGGEAGSSETKEVLEK